MGIPRKAYHDETAGSVCRYHRHRIELRIAQRTRHEGMERPVGWQMKALEYAIVILLAIVFMESVITGHVIRQVLVEQAKVSQLQPNTLLAMSLADLSNVPITQRVL